MLISSISVQPSLIQVRSRCSIQVLVLHVQMIGFRGGVGHGNVGGGQQTVWWQRWCSEAVCGARCLLQDTSGRRHSPCWALEPH